MSYFIESLQETASQALYEFQTNHHDLIIEKINEIFMFSRLEAQWGHHKFDYVIQVDFPIHHLLGQSIIRELEYSYYQKCTYTVNETGQHIISLEWSEL